MELSALLIIKIAMTLLVIILIPAYWKTYGVANFLWLSDIGLFMTLIAVWINSSLLISMAAILILPFEIVWIIDYLYQITTNRKMLGVVGYMFDKQYPAWIRALSLFHIPLPFVWIWLVYRWGYNIEAPIYATLLVWLVLTFSYFSTEPKENINWVHVPAHQKWHHFPDVLWYLMMLLVFPICIILPMHLLFDQFF